MPSNPPKTPTGHPANEHDRPFTSDDLATHLAAAHPNLVSPATARSVVDTIAARLISELAARRRVRIFGFGDFNQTTMPSRNIIIPATGDRRHLPATRYVSFRSARRLRRAISHADGRARRPAAHTHPGPQ